MKKIAFHTLGCKLNFTETATLSSYCEKRGYKTVPFHDTPDVYIINTCSVTENANKKCQKIIKEAKKIAPHSFVAILGCYAQLKPKELQALPGVDAVLGAKEKFHFIEILNQFTKKGIYNSPISEPLAYHTSFSTDPRTRSFLKVQDGCNYTCTFCTIPLARGKSRSGSIMEIVENAKQLVKKDKKEVVLTGVNIGDFGLVNGKREHNFLDLLKALNTISEIERFRISSIEPNLLTDEIIDFVAKEEKFVPHFHIPLQSGSDKILKKMQRRYLTDFFYSKIEKLKKTIPDCCIGIDVIVGFPDENEENFRETFDFLDKLQPSYLHVFSYSERENTKAIQFENKVKNTEIHDRSQRLRTFSNELKHRYYKKFEGTMRKVLFEAGKNENTMSGFTDNYIKIETPLDKNLINTIKNVRLQKVNPDHLMHISLN